MRHRFSRDRLGACLCCLALVATAGCSLTPSLPKWQWPWVARRQELDRALSLARLTERQGNLDEAMITYRKILEADPDNVLAHHRIGAVAVKERRFEDARVSFETAMRLAEPSAELLNDVGYLHYLRQDLPNAEASFRQSLAKDPRNKQARNNLGLALAEQERFDEALAEFRQVGTEAEAFSNLAYVQVKIGELAEAEKNCHKALSLDNSLRPAAEVLMQVADLKAKATGTVPPSMVSKVYSTPPAQRPAEGMAAGNSIVESVRAREDAPNPGNRNARRSLSSGNGELLPATFIESAADRPDNPAFGPTTGMPANDPLRPAGPTPVYLSPALPSATLPSATLPRGPAFPAPGYAAPGHAAASSGVPNSGVPSSGAPIYTAPSSNAPKSAAPSYPAPSPNAPRSAAPSYPAPSFQPPASAGQRSTERQPNPPANSAPNPSPFR